jgi:hypothetical protein
VATPAPTTAAVAAAPSGATTSGGASTSTLAASTPRPSATASPAALGPVGLVLDPKSIYDNWALAANTNHSVVLLISSDSCHGGPQISLDETATSVTILITEQLFGPFDCHGVLKIVREVASLQHPLGKRYLEGCRPMQEKDGARVNCRTVT